MPMPADVLGVQRQIKHNVEELREFISDLGEWEDDISGRDKELTTGRRSGARSALPPVRQRGFAEMVPSGMPGPFDKEREKEKQLAKEKAQAPIKPKNYMEYSQWDKLDVDGMLEEMEKEEKREVEDWHRARYKGSEDRAAREAAEAYETECIDRSADYKAKGNEALQQGNVSGAVKWYTRAVEVDKLNSVAFANRAQAFLELGKPKEALADANACLELEPKYVKAIFRRALAHSRLGDVEAAVKDAKAVVVLQPSNSAARALLKELAPAPKELTKAGVKGTTPPETSEHSSFKFKEGRKATSSQNPVQTTKTKDHEDKAIPASRSTPVEAPKAPPVPATTQSGENRVGVAPSVKETNFALRTTRAPKPAPKKRMVIIETGSDSSSSSSSEDEASPVPETAEDAQVSDQSSRKLPATMVAPTVDRALERAEAAAAKIQQLDPGAPMSPPRSAAAFERALRSFKGDDARLYQYIQSVAPEMWAKIFGDGLAEAVLLAVLRCVNTEYRRLGESAAACELLLSMSKVRRFDLVASFLFGKDKKLAEEVLHWLKSEGVQGVGPLMSLFGVSG